MLAGMKIAVAVKSDSGTDGDLGAVWFSEMVSTSYNHTGSAQSLPPLPSNNSTYMLVSGGFYDYHRSPVATILDLFGNHGGNGSYSRNQMFAFYCPRCGMTSGNAVAIPSSGYQTVRNIIGAGGTEVDFRVDQNRQAVTLRGFSTTAGSASANYSDTPIVRH